MKLSLTIHASAATIAAILASLPADAIATPSYNDDEYDDDETPLAPMIVAPAPVPAPFPPVTAPVPPVAPAATFEGVDSTGLPHDARIHSAKGTKTDAGAWRKRKGIDDATVAAVEAELRARVAGVGAAVPAPVMQMPAPAPVMQMPVAPVPLAPAPVMPMPAPAPVPPVAPVNMASPMPVAMPAPEPAPAMMPAPVAATGPLDFNGFMSHLSELMRRTDANGAPLIHAEYLASVTAEISTAFQVQLPAITDIGGNPAMIEYAIACLTRDGRW